MLPILYWNSLIACLFHTVVQAEAMLIVLNINCVDHLSMLATHYTEWQLKAQVSVQR